MVPSINQLATCTHTTTTAAVSLFSPCERGIQVERDIGRLPFNRMWQLPQPPAVPPINLICLYMRNVSVFRRAGGCVTAAVDSTFLFCDALQLSVNEDVCQVASRLYDVRSTIPLERTHKRRTASNSRSH